MALSEAQEKEVQAAMEAYATAYRMNDFGKLVEIFSPAVCGFGSGQDEVIRNQEDFERQIKRDFSQAKIDAMDFTETLINGEWPVAWVMTRNSISFSVPGSGRQTIDGRSTMVLRNEGGRWLFEQIHFSMPYGEQTEGQSYPVE